MTAHKRLPIREELVMPLRDLVCLQAAYGTRPLAGFREAAVVEVGGLEGVSTGVDLTPLGALGVHSIQRHLRIRCHHHTLCANLLLDTRLPS